jgi:hypothetical protein
MPVAPAEIETVLQLLSATPRRLEAMTRGLDSTRLHFKPDAAAWSVSDILAHLRACADVWGDSIRAMLARDHPTLRYVSPRTWMRKTDYPALEFRQSFAAFAQQRRELVRSLKAIDRDGWSRGATFTGTTKGREQTVLNYARRIAEHEVQHLEQVASLVSGHPP